MNYVEDDEEIVNVSEGLDCLRCDPPVFVEPGGMKAHMDAVHRDPVPAVPLKPWEHYTIADGLLREARGVLAQANEYGARLTADYRRDPIGTTSRELHGNGVASWATARLQRAQALAALAQAHSAQASAGALLMQHYSARFSELWSPGNIASTSKEERDAELDAWPGTAKRPAE